MRDAALVPVMEPLPDPQGQADAPASGVAPPRNPHLFQDIPPRDMLPPRK